MSADSNDPAHWLHRMAETQRRAEAAKPDEQARLLRLVNEYEKLFKIALARAAMRTAGVR